MTCVLVSIPTGNFFASFAAAQDTAKKTPELSKEERLKRADTLEKMAEVHRHTAECLRSDKRMSECHDAMMKECPMTKEGHCPMMDERGWMKDMHDRKHGKSEHD